MDHTATSLVEQISPQRLDTKDGFWDVSGWNRKKEKIAERIVVVAQGCGTWGRINPILIWGKKYPASKEDKKLLHEMVEDGSLAKDGQHFIIQDPFLEKLREYWES